MYQSNIYVQPNIIVILEYFVQLTMLLSPTCISPVTLHTYLHTIIHNMYVLFLFMLCLLVTHSCVGTHCYRPS